MGDISYTELGVTGTTDGFSLITNEFLFALKGENGRRKYNEMRLNDPVIGSILFTIDMLIRSVRWDLAAPNEEKESFEIRDFVNSCMHDMQYQWTDFISEVLEMLPFGFSFFETVYKQRLNNKEFSSKYSDGKIGWKKFGIRPAITLDRWKFNDSGDVIAFIQNMPSGGFVEILIEKGLLFRTTIKGGNPEGRSILRNAYRPYYFKTKFEEIEGIGIERDLAGLPVAEIRSDYLATDAPADKKALVVAIKKILMNIRLNHQAAIVWPIELDDNGHETLRLKLLTSGGKREFTLDPIISRHNRLIAMTCLADFILLGHEKVGSFALSSDKTALFVSALGAWLGSISSVIENNAIPSLLRLNGYMDPGNYPNLIHSDIESPNLTELGTFISSLSGLGIDLTDLETENKLRSIANLPTITDDK